MRIEALTIGSDILGGGGGSSGAFLLEPIIFQDERGYFFESFREEIFREKIGDFNFMQENESYSSYGVLRGLHYQIKPFAQAKLLRVAIGKVLDIAVDIRENSPTFGKHIRVELSGENHKQLFIPEGFAHGFVTLSDFAIFQYKVNAPYNKKSERSILYNDSFLGIDWRLPEDKLTISRKDRAAASFKDAEIFEAARK